MKKALKISLTIIFWIGIWYLAVLLYSLKFDLKLTGNDLFPYPHQVIIKLSSLLLKLDFYLATLSSLLRIAVSTSFAVIFGVVFAILCSKFDFLNFILKPFLTTVKSVPVTVFAFILYILIFEFTSIVITFLMVFPIVFANVYEGIKNIDKDLLEVCQQYHIPFAKRVKSLYLPTVMPYFVSALSTSIGLAWKAGIAAEAIYPPNALFTLTWKTRFLAEAIFPKNISMGAHISLAKQETQSDTLFAWALTLVVINIVIELLIKKLIKIAFKKWLPSEVKNENNYSY